MSWLKTTLGPHVDLTSGPAFESRYFTDDPSDIPLVKGENIGQGMIHWDKSKYWPRTESDGYDKFVLKPGDIVLAMDRPWISAGLKFAVISERDPEALLVQRVACMRGVNGLSSKYLRYIIASPQFSAYAKNIMGGTNVPHISGNQIRAFPFSLPPKGEQQRITSILSPYDDLIENNRRRIALLEEAARLLYREWFVHLRFPGHEHVAIKDGVPEGWEKKALSELAEFINGFAFKPMHLGEVGLPIVKIPELKQGVSEKTPRNPGDLIPEKYHLCDGDILFSWSGTLAVNVWANGPAILNQHLFNVVPNGIVSRAFLMFTLREALNRFDNQTVGATMKHIRRSALDKVFVLLPDHTLLITIDEILNNTYEQLIALHKQNQKLAQARDLLLPRLMNGEIAV